MPRLNMGRGIFRQGITTPAASPVSMPMTLMGSSNHVSGTAPTPFGPGIHASASVLGPEQGSNENCAEKPKHDVLNRCPVQVHG